MSIVSECFNQSLLVIAICGANVINDILVWNSVGYFGDTFAVAVKEGFSSSGIMTDKVVHSFLQ